MFQSLMIVIRVSFRDQINARINQLYKNEEKWSELKFVEMKMKKPRSDN